MSHPESGKKEKATQGKTLKSQIEKMVAANTDLVVEALLNHEFWLPSLETMTAYERLSDDTDGGNSYISVVFSRDADAWIEILSHLDEKTARSFDHRFRTGFGGGQSLRIRKALLILAKAIQMDNAEHPQRRANS